MKFAKTLFRRGGNSNPDRDWRFLFGSFLVLAIIIFIAAISLYWILDTLETVSQARMAKVLPARLDEPALERAVTILRDKKAKFDALLTTPFVIVDPSR